MDIYILALLIIGLLLLLVTMGSGWIKRLPLSYALIYLVVGIFLGPYGTNLIQLQPQTEFLERITEFVVIVSLFSCGLKMNRPLRLRAWNSTIRLIAFLMPISIFAIAAISHWLLNLNWGAAVLLGAILAPTDPVLASEVQLAHIGDRDELRFGLTSEGGLNDALAFPFVYFGIHWLENNNWQSWLKQWIVVDLIWAIAAGIAMGILVGNGVMWIKQQLQKFRPIDVLMEDFIGLSIILITYALTELINGYGFLSVFVAGLMVQRISPNHNRRLSQLEFTEKLEKLMEVGTILLLGSLLRIEPILKFGGEALLIAGLLIFAIRPLGAWISTTNLGFAKLPRSQFHPTTRWLFGWFGVRGVGSLYYLSYSLGKSLEGELGERIAWITSITVVLSIIIHGISATPLMKWYEKADQERTHNA
ncbi:transporter, CPA2 family [Coleofasciculus chthonoplastes PCC 7420]|uniref:Transporter, CPA2 family n=1 Tax=Coleofasciculus chthonoplastes PCC 7420 TaxID=118168 RepID=B4VZS8_9CYAN|nr:sodium:proton antiporter [Coleofasciculus chthonoplastes]EDX72600.1 transporter, CPA2 family [Coleofasciculus chthonoplastes PCC 7420]